jgi:hypothetical protein
MLRVLRAIRVEMADIDWRIRLSMLAVLLLASCQNSSTPSPSAAKKTAPSNPHLPVQQLEALSIDEAGLTDDEPVVGVSTGSHARAYAVAVLEMATEDSQDSDFGSTGRILNDTLGEVAISVTYSAATRRFRVLTSPYVDQLDLTVATQGNEPDEKEMVIVWKDKRYLQSDPMLPLQDHSFELTTWGKWKSEHPLTDVYIGPLDKG